MSKYIIKSGDTMQSVAQQTLGDSSQWIAIAAYNNLIYPFISSISSVGVLIIGNSIDIPDSNNPITDMTTVLTDLQIFGSDLQLTLDYNMDMSSADRVGELVIGSYGDLQTADGIYCLIQDLIHVLITPLGSISYHPTYGSNFLNIIGSKKSIGWDQRAVTEFTKSIKSDSRVVDVQNIVITSFPCGASLECNIITITGTIPFNHDFGGVSSGV